MQAKRPVCIGSFRIVLLLLFWLLPHGATAHPEDEFCMPGESGLDPALCEQLAALDSADGKTARLVTPILDDSGNARGALSTFMLYVSIGVNHILPGGLDHILFVLALVLARTKLKPLVVQVSAFTLAHTVTLGLAATGVLSPPASVVEPLIAASIAFVAIENLFVKDAPRWRPLIVFLFGLLHGLGFAGFFGELGLPSGQFWSALFGFNVGVELGQFAVIAVAMAILMAGRRWAGSQVVAEEYRTWVVLPGSAAIGAIGLWWAIERSLLA
ncbi:MAG: HupE/UreJ family protein [Woeseiaceae bacterium]